MDTENLLTKAAEVASELASDEKLLPSERLQAVDRLINIAQLRVGMDLVQ